MLNLYEILEVSEKASKEIIEKAYKVLAKKYHPDLQKDENKKDAEIKMKQINEAYEVLSSDEKRKKYDLELKIKREEQIKIQLENEIKIEINNQEERIKKYENNLNKDKIENEQKQNMQILQNEMKRAYANAYNEHLRNLGYKVKEPWTFKRFIELVKGLAIFAAIIAILWFFPPTHKLIMDFYEHNDILKAAVRIISDIFVGIWNGIIRFLSTLFSF